MSTSPTAATTTIDVIDQGRLICLGFEDVSVTPIRAATGGSRWQTFRTLGRTR